MSSIVIVLPKIEDGKRIRDILAKRGYEIDAVCSTAAAALGEMNNLNGGIVICGQPGKALPPVILLPQGGRLQAPGYVFYGSE